jgi:cell division protein FtsZ
MPTAYDSGADQEYEAEGLGEQADDDAFDANDGGYASLAGTRIERDPAAGEDSEGDADEEALELTFEAENDELEEAEPEVPADELLLDASRLAEADEPPHGGRRRRILGSGAEESETPPPQRRSAPPSPPPGGSTLFERMANLSRASARRDDEDDDEDEGSSGSLRIPRFLGRQNNQ